MYFVQLYNIFGRKTVLIAVKLSWIVVEFHGTFDGSEGKDFCRKKHGPGSKTEKRIEAENSEKPCDSNKWCLWMKEAKTFFTSQFFHVR